MTTTEERIDENASYGAVPTRYKGLDVVERRAEIRGMEGGLNKGVTVQTVPDGLDPVFFTGKAVPIGERYEFLVKTQKGDDWRVVGPQDDRAEAVAYIRIFKPVFAMFSDEELVGDVVHEAMDAAAQAEALRKEGQQAMEPLEDPSLNVVELNNLMKKLAAAGVPDTPADRQAYFHRVFGEHVDVLRQSHKEAIEADLADEEEDDVVVDADLAEAEDDTPVDPF